MSKDIPNKKVISAYFHCAKCIDELPVDESPESYARLSVGFTDLGLQVWCVRHDVNVLHVDFEGHRHPANTSIDSGTPAFRAVAKDENVEERQEDPEKLVNDLDELLALFSEGKE